MKEVFERSATRYFYPLANNEPLQLPAQTVTFYFFTQQPSFDDAQSGTGAFATVTSTTIGASTPWPVTFVLPAIDDPAPDSAWAVYTYWYSVKFINVAGGDAQCVIRSFEISRVEGNDNVPGTTVQQLKDIYPAISAYATDAQLTAHIASAQEELKLEFKKRGLPWSRISDLSDITLALAFRTIANVSLSQIQLAGDRFEVRYVEFNTRSRNLLDGLKLQLDTDGDGLRESESTAASNAWTVIR